MPRLVSSWLSSSVTRVAVAGSRKGVLLTCSSYDVAYGTGFHENSGIAVRAVVGATGKGAFSGKGRP